MDSDELYYAYMVFPYVVRNPSVPDWDPDGNLTLPYLTYYGPDRLFLPRKPLQLCSELDHDECHFKFALAIDKKSEILAYLWRQQDN